MGVWLVNKTQNPLFLPYPYRGLLAAGAKVPVNLTEEEAYTALAIVPGQRQNAIAVEANAPGPFNDLVAGDAADGLLIGAIQSPLALSNVVFIQQLADFPAPAAGVITLASNTVYKINGDVVVSPNRFFLSDGTIVQGFSSAANDGLTSTATGALFTHAGSTNFAVNFLALTNAGELFDIQGAPVLMALRGLVSDAGNLGTLGGGTINVRDCIFDGFDFGFDFVVGGASVEFSNVHFGQGAATAGAKCLDFGSNVWTSFIRVQGCDFVPSAGGIAISGLIDNGNLSPGVGDVGLADVTNSTFAGLGANLENITINDLRWTFRSLLGQQNSALLGALEITTPASTTIGAPSTFVKVAGTTTIVISARFDPAPGFSNRLRFLGITPLPLRLDITGNIEKDAGGGSVLWELAIFKNTSQLGTATIFADADSRGAPFALTQVDPTGSADDFYEVFVSNTEGSDNCTVTELSMLASAFPSGA